MNEKHLLRFSSYFKLDDDFLFTLNFDENQIRKIMFVDPSEIPEAYQEHANSYLRSSFYIVEYLKLLYGTHFVDQTLLQLGVSPVLFNNLDRKVNIRLVNDLLQVCKKMGFSDADFENLAGSMFLSVEDGKQSQGLQTFRDPVESVYYLEKIIPKFDNNFHCQFSVGLTGARMICTPSDEVMRAEEKKLIDLQFLNFYRGLLFKHCPRIGSLNSFHNLVCLKSSGRQPLAAYRIDF